MKKLLVLFLITLGTAGMSQAQSKCYSYYYVTLHADASFEVYKGEELKIIHSNIVKTEWECNTYRSTYSVLIENQFHDALKAKYPKTYFHTGEPTVLGPYDSYEEAAKKARKNKGDSASKGYKIIDFYFRYYDKD